MHRVFPLLIVICIVLTNSQSPGPIILRDSQGVAVDEILVTSLIPMDIYTFECDVEKGKWSINPNLPSGMRFNTDSRTISGTVHSVFPKQQFNVTVTTDSGSSSLLFYVEVVYCVEGFYTIRHIEAAMKGSIHLEHNGVVLEDSPISYEMADRYFCIPRGNLQFSLNCTSSWTGQCIGIIQTTTNTTFIFLRSQVGNIEEQTVSMTAQNPPILSVSTNNLVVYAGEGINVQFSVTEIYSDITFDPPLPTSLTFIPNSLTLKGSLKEEGTYTFVASTYNEKGESTLSFIAYVDTCSDELTLLRFSRDRGTVDGYRITTLEGQQLVDEKSINTYYKKNFCLPAGEYYLYMRSAEGTTKWQDPLILKDQSGSLLESFLMVSSEPEQQERFVVGDVVAMGSVFRYSTSFSNKWVEKKFNDKDWKEGSSGVWGQYDEGSTVYFRQQFFVSNPAKYSLILIDMVVQEEAVVYLNGKDICRFSQSAEVMRASALVPTIYLVKKVNQLAVSLHRPTSLLDLSIPVNITFDMRLHLSTSQCLIPSLSGQAFDDQPNPDPSHSASDAFTDSFLWWLSTTLPVNLYYILDNNTFISPSVLRIGTPSSLDGRPRALRVYGRVVDQSNNNTVLIEDEIASINSPTFLLLTDVEMVQLASKRPYNAFRIAFTDTANHTLLRAGYLQFSVCQEAYCKKKIGWPSTLVGNTVNGRCPFGSYGRNHHICGRKDVEPVWIDDRSMCLANYASNGYAFVDTGIHIDGVRQTAMKNVENAAISLICGNLTVWKDQISFPIVILNADETLSLDIVMRFTVEQEIGDYVLKKMKQFQDHFVYELKEKLGSTTGFVDLMIVSDPTLRLPFPWSTVVLVIVCIVSILLAFVFGLFCMYVHFRSNKDGHRKQLKKKKKTKQEQVNLLEESV